MERELLYDKRMSRGGRPEVSINPKTGKMVIRQQAYHALKKKFGKDFQYMQIYVTKGEDSALKRFWLEPAEHGAEGARKINQTAKSRSVSVKSLTNWLELNGERAKVFELHWDDENGAYCVDTYALGE